MDVKFEEVFKMKGVKRYLKSIFIFRGVVPLVVIASISFNLDSVFATSVFLVDKNIIAERLYLVGSTLVIRTYGGNLYRWNDIARGKPEPLRVEMGAINRSYQRGNTLLFAGPTGSLYRWNDATQGEPERVDVNLGQVSSFYQVGSTLLVSTTSRLYRWDDVTSGNPELVRENMTIRDHFYQVGPTLLLGTEGGLYRWNDLTKGKPELVSEEMGSVFEFLRLDGTMLFGTDRGLYRWDDLSQGKPERINLEFGGVNNFHLAGGTIIIDAQKGLYRWNTELNGIPELVDEEDSSRLDQEMPFFKFIQVGSTLLLITPEALYRWNDVSQGAPEEVDIRRDMGIPTEFTRLGNTSLYGTENGLYRWDDVTQGRPEPVDLGMELWEIYNSQQAGSSLFIGTKAGLLRIEGLGVRWDARIEVDEASGPFFSDSAIPIHWKIGNYEQRATPQNVVVRVLVKGPNGAFGKDAAGNLLPPEGWQINYGVNGFVTPKLLPGTYEVIVRAVDLIGNPSDSKPMYLTVYSSPAAILLRSGKFVGFIYAVFNLFVFLILVLGARKSRRCFELLTDPLTRKFGIYFGFALRYFTPVRIWVFERYFDKLKREWPSSDSYVPYCLLPLGNESEEQNSITESTKLIEYLGTEHRMLLLGGPGTGKTELIRHLMQTYCQQTSLRAAWKRYGFIPIWVNLRELASSSDVTLYELARATLEGNEFKFHEGDSYFNLLLKSGGFLVILDGLNEVDIDSGVNRFAAVMPAVKLLVTSQTDSLSNSFKRYKVPFFDPEFAKTLLRKFIGLKLAERTIHEVPELWEEIGGGYDVRLIEQIVRAKETRREVLRAQTTKAPEYLDLTKPGQSDSEDFSLPRNRLDLYKATIKLSDNQYEKTKIETRAFPWAIVCERAWNMWVDRLRRFQPDDNLTDTDCRHLDKTNILVRRSNEYEFSHDLMRAFLTALWCVRYTHSIDSLIAQRLKGDAAAKIWTLSPDDQIPIFTFLTELIEGQEDLQRISQFAAAQVGERQQLLISAQQTARNKSWQVQVQLNPSP